MAQRNHDSFQRRNPDDGTLLPLDEAHIEYVERKVHADPKYGPQGKELHDFISQYPDNIKRDIVIHKILLIDFTYSTNLRFCSSRSKTFSIFKLADQMIEWKIDEKIKNGDPDIVDMIAKYEGANNFSFATKYCSYHNPRDYSIFDRIVLNTLPQYLDVTQKTINRYKKRGYKEYHNLMTDFIRIYDLNCVSGIRRKIDHFLWYQSKLIDEQEESENNNE